MRRGGPALLALVVLAGCASGAGPGPLAGGASGTPRAERPTYAVGDRWIRSDGVFELIRIEGDTYVFAPDARDEIHLSRDLAVVLHRTFRREYLQFIPTPRLDWPLEVGKRGAVAGRFQNLGGEPYDAGLTWVVDAHEDVTVPAGTFKAFRVTFTVTPHQTSFGTAYRGVVRPGPVSYRFWYAPQVRQLVKADGDLWPMRFELVAVDPGESEPLKVVVHEPADQARFGPETDAAVTGKATGGKGVARITVAVNGEVVATESPKGDVRRTVMLNQRLPLRDGKNVILVTATDPTGVASQEARTVFYAAPPSIALPAKGEMARVGSQYVSLRVPVPTDRAVTAASVAVNEILVGSSYPGAWKAGVFETRLQLREGENLVRIRYDTESAEQRVEERTIVFDPALGAPVHLAGETERAAEEERRQAEAQRLAAEQKLAEERRLADEQRRRDEAQRLADEQRRQAEEQRLAAERKRAEDQRLAEDQRRRAEAQHLAAEQKLAEERRRAEEQRRRDDAQRLADEQRRQAEEQRLAAERKRADDQRQAEEQRRREEAQRIAALPPLQLALSSPRDQARYEHASVGLAGVVSGGKGISRVTVALNGVEVRRQEERAPRRAVELSLPIVLREGQNTLVVTATEADGTLSQEVRTVFFEPAQPLTVAVRFPADQARVGEPDSVAAAIVSSSKGVARVSVSVNGVEVHQQVERTPQRSLLVTAPLRLKPGANVIAFSATDAAGAVSQDVRTVFLTAPATAPAAPRHERWAVVIGVGEYEHPAISRLRYAVADAESIYETLIGPAGFRKEHVLLITDKTERRPTLKNIKWALGTFLARSARKDDTVLIFFAGHGAPEVDQRGLERDGLAKYLIPTDAEADDLYSSALPMDELQTIFGRIEAERVVAFLDTCYSGAAGGRTFQSRKTRAAGIDDLFLERLTRSKGRAIITASRPSEVSIELPELGHGIFTYYLVNGLKGAGDLNRDGIVSLQELYEYVEAQVTAKSRAVGGSQHPVMKGELEGALPLVKVPGR